MLKKSKSFDKNSNILLKKKDIISYLQLRKKYINKLNQQIIKLESVKEKNYKSLNSVLLATNFKMLPKKSSLVTYIINISFLRTNVTLQVMDVTGKLKFFCSAGSVNFKGKQKRARLLVLNRLINFFISRVKFLKGKPIGLHLKNVGNTKFLIIRKLKHKFFIKIIKTFELFPHNGCRKKKLRRKRIRSKRKKMEKWLSGLKRQIVNLLSFLIVGSNPTFFKFMYFRNMA